MKLSIITLNYKKPNLTIVCLESLYKQYKKEFERDEYELVIVDNDSQDNSVSILQAYIKKQKYKKIQLIEHKENAGFGAGNNVGAYNSSGKYIVFLNNDTEVKDTGLLKMVEHMEKHSEIAILGGQLRNENGSLQASVGKFYTLSRALMLLLGMQRFGLSDRSPNHIEKVDWVKGGLMMIRKEVFEKLGGFDEKIFMYTEDMELCYRAHLVGYAIYFYPDIVVLHAEHGSSNRTFAIINIYKNLLYFYKKHRTVQEYIVLKCILWSKAIILVTCGKITHNAYLTTTYEKALEVLG